MSCQAPWRKQLFDFPIYAWNRGSHMQARGEEKSGILPGGPRLMGARHRKTHCHLLLMNHLVLFLLVVSVKSQVSL